MTEQTRKPIPRGQNPRSALVDFVRAGLGAEPAADGGINERAAAVDAVIGPDPRAPRDIFDAAALAIGRAFSSEHEPRRSDLAGRIKAAQRTAPVESPAKQGQVSPSALPDVADMSPEQIDVLRAALDAREMQLDSAEDAALNELVSGSLIDHGDENEDYSSLWPGIPEATEADLQELEDERELEEFFASLSGGEA